MLDEAVPVPGLFPCLFARVICSWLSDLIRGRWAAPTVGRRPKVRSSLRLSCIIQASGIGLKEGALTRKAMIVVHGMGEQRRNSVLMSLVSPLLDLMAARGDKEKWNARKIDGDLSFANPAG
jgi:hypothetical protein